MSTKLTVSEVLADAAERGSVIARLRIDESGYIDAFLYNKSRHDLVIDFVDEGGDLIYQPTFTELKTAVRKYDSVPWYQRTPQLEVFAEALEEAERFARERHCEMPLSASSQTQEPEKLEQAELPPEIAQLFGQSPSPV
jgi:hypothetical protein